MRHLLFYSLFVLTSLSTAACLTNNNSNDDGWNWSFNSGTVKGEGPIVERELQLDDFTGFSLNLSADVTLHEGPQRVVVSGQANIIDLIETDVSGGFWKIKTRKSIRATRGLKIDITIPSLTAAHINGSGDIKGTDTFSGAGNLELKINGSGSIDVSANTSSVSAGINGSGDITVTGEANEVDISINGSGDVHADNLTADTVSVKTTGSGDAQVHANQELEVRISGSGDVRYKGTPRVSSRVSGSGDLVAM